MGPWQKVEAIGVAEAAQQQSFPTWIRETRAPVPLPPPKSCDCQFHIYGDPKRYPPKKNAYYEPPDATFEDMRGVLAALGFQRGVIVHPMPYGTDHRLLIDTLGSLEAAERRNFRATAIINDAVSDAEMARLDSLGVCAARFNLGRRYQQNNPRDEVIRSIARIREIGWHMRLHVGGDDILADADFLKSMTGLPIVVDHMGHLDFGLGLQQPACRWLIDRVKNADWWLMLSNGNRDSTMESGWDDAVPFGRAYVEAAPDRMIWGTDWPHVNWRKRMMNDAETVELLYRYVDNDRTLLEKILVTNPARLHGFEN
jgi:predicted TIM-barrel fold metal-dependent hydrolase